MSAELLQAGASAIILSIGGLLILLFLSCLIKTLKAIRDREVVDVFVGLFATLFFVGLILVVIGSAAESGAA